MACDDHQRRGRRLGHLGYEADSRYRRRIFIYQHGTYNAFHMGVNGIGNLEEAWAVYVGNLRPVTGN